MKKHSIKQALLMSVVSLLLCVSMLVGTTFAWFTDSVTSANNIIKSGNLDVEMYWADGTQAIPSEDTGWTDASTGAIFNYNLWEPGYTQVRHIKISNNGSLALQYKVSILANGEVSDLSDVIDVYYIDPAVQVANRAALTDADKLGTLTEVLAQLGQTGSGTLLAGENDTITIAFKMQESAGNEYMNKSIGTDFSILLNATQLTYENDSFDNQYDADAANPSFSAPTQIPESGPMTIGDDDFSTTLPADLVGNLRDALGDENNDDYVPSLSLMLAGRKANNVYRTLNFTVADVVDENANVVDLEGMNNQFPIIVKVNVSDVYKEGDLVKIYHDGVFVADATVDAGGYITYEALHFCEIEIVDPSTILISTAEEFIEALSAIRADAKLQIPSSAGNNRSYRVNANFVLVDDIVIDSTTAFMYTDSNGAPLHFYGVRGSINLNGHNINVTSDALMEGKAYANATLLFQYSEVDIIGEGSIVVENQSKAVFAWANCTVNIYGGTYISNSSERNSAAVYVNNTSATINVYGGTYTETEYAFNAHDTSANAPVIVLHEGITYKDFLKNGTTDVIASDISSGRIVMADGCELQEYEENGAAMNKVVAN